MSTFFLKVLEMSLYGSIAILVVLLFRLIFKKCPKRVMIIFWIVVAFRLVCPFNLSSPTSALNIKQLFEKEQTSVTEVISEKEADLTSEVVLEKKDVPEKKSVKEDLDNISIVVNSGKEDSRTFTMMTFIACLWFGIALSLFLVFFIRYARFYSKARWCSRSYDGRYYMADILSPFVIGFVEPKIFVPVHMDENEREYVLNHEWTHIKNKDGIIKLVCYVILCLHWFNPFVWLAYIMLCADMEMRVDEETTSMFDAELIKEYCMSIVLHASEYRRGTFMQNTAFSGLGFGGMEAKIRVANLLKKSKASKAFQIVSVILTLTFAVLLSTASYSFRESGLFEPPETKISETSSSSGSSRASESSDPESTADTDPDDYAIPFEYDAEGLFADTEFGTFHIKEGTNKIILSCNDQTFEYEFASYEKISVGRANFFYKDGNIYIYVNNTNSSGAIDTYIFTYKDYFSYYIEIPDTGLTSVSDPDSFYAYLFLDSEFNSYFRMYLEYRIDKNGLPEVVNNIYYFDNYSYRVRFNYYIFGNIIRGGEVTSEQYCTGLDEYYTLIDTDGESFLDVMTSDGTVVRLNFSEPFRTANSTYMAYEYPLSKALLGAISDYKAPWE